MSNLFLKEITPRNILSFGPATEPIQLGMLNVLIGPNGSGKSNLIECISLLSASPKNMRSTILKGGGVAEWIWKGKPSGSGSLEIIANSKNGNPDIRHGFSFQASQQSFYLTDEFIESVKAVADDTEPAFFYRYENGNPILNELDGKSRQLVKGTVRDDQSILSQLKDPEVFPELAFLSDSYGQIKIYRYWEFGRNAIYRNPQPSDQRVEVLEEDFSNLGLFLNYLRTKPQTKRQISTLLGEVYDGIDDFDVSIVGNTVSIYFTEGDYTIPSTRLSDGTLRFLCLLAILCDPSPPPLICIEEPELGLHPDVLPKLAEIIIEASSRTQLVITTHSDVIINALSDIPESVLVCEKHDGQTYIKRLDHDEVAPFLESYKLGELWLKGNLGGTRW